jgi:hypothetical protein
VQRVVTVRQDPVDSPMKALVKCHLLTAGKCSFSTSARHVWAFFSCDETVKGREASRRPCR